MPPTALALERLGAQGLSRPDAPTPEAVVERLLAVQAQDFRAARLAVRARSAGLTAQEVDRALTERRSLVVSWLNRGTLHLVGADDFPWLHALVTPPLFTGNARRLAQEGVAPAAAERGVALVERCLVDEGPLTRAQLRARLQRAGVPTAGQALVHLLMLACLRRVAVRGPVTGGEQAYALVRDWLGEPPPVERPRALAELARRYLRGHAPASDRDLAKWSGLPLRDARAGLRAIGSELELGDDGLVRPARRAPDPASTPPARLLGAWEPVLCGWASRAPVLGAREPLIVSQGVFRPFGLVGGAPVATWRLVDAAVVLEPFSDVGPGAAAALRADAADVEAFFAGSYSR